MRRIGWFPGRARIFSWGVEEATHREYEASDEKLKGGGVKEVADLFLVFLKPRFGLRCFSRSLGALAEIGRNVTTLICSGDPEVIRSACVNFVYSTVYMATLEPNSTSKDNLN